MTAARAATDRGTAGQRSRQLQLARAAAGWKQSQLLIRLEAAGRRLDVEIAPRPSLKTMVSKWENGAAMSADYRRLFRDVYGMTDEQLGFEAHSTSPLAPLPALAASAVGQMVQMSAQLRHGMDTLIEREPTTAEGLDSLDELVDLHARDCVRVPPLVMLTRLLSDFREVEALASHRHQPRTLLRLYAITANYASLIADEMMVLGQPGDSQAWHCTAKTAADQTEDPALQARTRSLNALLYLYFGDPARAVALAQQAQASPRSRRQQPPWPPPSRRSPTPAAETRTPAAARCAWPPSSSIDSSRTTGPTPCSDSPKGVGSSIAAAHFFASAPPMKPARPPTTPSLATPSTSWAIRP